MSNSFIGGSFVNGSSTLLENSQTIDNATGIVSLDYSDNKTYIITQGNGDLTLEIASGVNDRNTGGLFLQRNIDYSVYFSGINVVDKESILSRRTLEYSGLMFDVSPQSLLPYSFSFNNDGTKGYVSDVDGSDVIYQYTLSNPYDISSMSYDGVSFSVGTGNVFSIEFNNDGTKMYLAGNVMDSVRQYTLSTPFDISTASYDLVDYNNPYGGYIVDAAFNNDGSKLYIINNDGSISPIKQYSLSTPFDISTISYDGVEYIAGSGTFSINFGSGGSKLYLVDFYDPTIMTELELSIPYDLSTASYNGRSYTIENIGTIRDLVYVPNKSTIYLTSDTDKAIYQYSIGIHAKLDFHIYGNYKTAVVNYEVN